MNLRALIVDDEELARQVLRDYAREIDGLEIVGECGNGFDAVKIIGELKPDIVFLDVQMPKLDGFEVLDLADPLPAVIFVTAFDQFAIRAFEAHAIDYLLKPIPMDRFKKAIERARARLGEPLPSAERLKAAALFPDKRLERLAVRDGVKIHIITIENLDYIKAQDDYIALHSGNRNYLKQQTISNIESQLDPARFARIHRSYIVNLERIVRIEPLAKDNHVAILKDGAQIPISRSGLARLKMLLGST